MRRPSRAIECLCGGDYTLRVLKMRMRVTITRMAPMAMMTQTQIGVAGSAGGAAGGAGAGSVCRLKVADQSLGYVLAIDFEGLYAPEVIGAVVQRAAVFVGGGGGGGGYDQRLELRILGEVELVLGGLFPGAP